jgi:hypothetical protein
MTKLQMLQKNQDESDQLVRAILLIKPDDLEHLRGTSVKVKRKTNTDEDMGIEKWVTEKCSAKCRQSGWLQTVWRGMPKERIDGMGTLGTGSSERRKEGSIGRVVTRSQSAHTKSTTSSTLGAAESNVSLLLCPNRRLLTFQRSNKQPTGLRSTNPDPEPSSSLQTSSPNHTVRTPSLNTRLGKV